MPDGSRWSGSRLDADIIIVGGGCAGLSLAARLAERPGQAGRVLITEQRSHYYDDRTFSFWGPVPPLFHRSVRASWTSWCVQSGARRIERSHPETAYHSLRSEDFYRASLAAIARDPDFEIRHGITAGHVGEDDESAVLQTAHGRLRAGLIIDTRPLPPSPAAHGLLQLFTGAEIETPAPCFNDAAAELMVFDPPNPRFIGFTYVLPFTPTRALIEYTRFAADPIDMPGEADLLPRLQARAPSGYTVQRREAGALTMRVDAPPRAAGRRILSMGTLAGAARASTGYAFAGIQAQATSLAARVCQGWQAASGWRPDPPPVWLREMDRIFLRVLRQNPAAGPALFIDLFEHCPPDRLVRFLSGAAGIGEALDVVRALPVAPFIRHGLLGVRA